MKGPALFTAPIEYPVTLDEFRDHLDMTDKAKDAYLLDLIRAATEAAENETWSRFIEQSWDLWLDGFHEKILLPYPPALSITQVTYIDAAGATQTLAGSVYELGERNGMGWLRLKYGQSWPSIRGHYDDVAIRWKCGYGATAASVPYAVKQAIKIIGKHFFENPEMVVTGAIVSEIPYTAMDLLSQHTWRTVA